MSVRPSGPEHIKYIDGAAADVWAAGSLLYSVLTGVLPFPTSRHVHGKARRLAAQRAQESWVSSHGPCGLASVCMQCIVSIH